MAGSMSYSMNALHPNDATVYGVPSPRLHGASVIEVRLSYLRPAVEALAAKVDQANQDRAAGDVMLAEKIDNVSKVVLKIDSQLTAIPWVGGGLVALVTLAITVGKAFKWF